jgi:hypothetical protein
MIRFISLTTENFSKFSTKHITDEVEALRLSEVLLEGLELLVTTPATFLLSLLPTDLCGV